MSNRPDIGYVGSSRRWLGVAFRIGFVLVGVDENAAPFRKGV